MSPHSPIVQHAGAANHPLPDAPPRRHTPEEAPMAPHRRRPDTEMVVGVLPRGAAPRRREAPRVAGECVVLRVASAGRGRVGTAVDAAAAAVPARVPAEPWCGDADCAAAGVVGVGVSAGIGLSGGAGADGRRAAGGRAAEAVVGAETIEGKWKGATMVGMGQGVI